MKILKNKVIISALFISFLVGFISNNFMVYADSKNLVNRTLINGNRPNKAIENLENGKPAKIVFFGDSNTDCYYGYSMKDGVLNTKVEKHPEIIEKFLKNKYGSSNISVINSGVHGNNVKDLNDRLYKDVIRHNPDVIVLNIGTNDSNEGWKEKFLSLEEYEKEYETLINKILNYNSNIDIIIRSSNYLFKRNEKLYDYDSVARKLAEKYNLEFLDFNYIMSKDIKDNKIKVNDGEYSEGSNKLYKEPLMTDGIHLTFSGQNIQQRIFIIYLPKIKYLAIFIYQDILTIFIN